VELARIIRLLAKIIRLLGKTHVHAFSDIAFNNV